MIKIIVGQRSIACMDTAGRAIEMNIKINNVMSGSPHTGAYREGVVRGGARLNGGHRCIHFYLRRDKYGEKFFCLLNP